jgi:hypothetical protein
MGVYAVTLRADSNYGVYTPDNIYSSNLHTSGAIMQVMQNGGDAALEPGDVVAFSGMAAPLNEGGNPVIQVSRVAQANSTAVAGVVFSRYAIETLARPLDPAGGPDASIQDITPEGPAQPGEYLLIVVQGPAQVKASAVGGPIAPGSLISSAATPGYAGKAGQVQAEGVSFAAPGTVLGKALESLDAGTGLITIFVTLQ